MQLVKPTHIVQHTIGATDRLGRPLYTDPSAAAVRRYHIETKGWSDIGYHWLVRVNGDLEPGRPESRMGAHVEGFNAKAIGIVCCGHGDIQDFTPAQKKTLLELVPQILRRHGLVEEFIKNPMRYLGHRECYALPGVPNTGKSCPGRFVDMRLARLAVMGVFHPSTGSKAWVS